MPFVKGQSDNPGGRPKEVGEVRESARQHSADAINMLVAMLKAKNERTRVAAAECLLDRGWGRAQQPVTVEEENPFIGVLRAINAIRKGENGAMPDPADSLPGEKALH